MCFVKRSYGEPFWSKVFARSQENMKLNPTGLPWPQNQHIWIQAWLILFPILFLQPAPPPLPHGNDGVVGGERGASGVRPCLGIRVTCPLLRIGHAGAQLEACFDALMHSCLMRPTMQIMPCEKCPKIGSAGTKGRAFSFPHLPGPQGSQTLQIPAQRGGGG